MDYSNLNLTDEVAMAFEQYLSDDEVTLLSDTFGLEGDPFHQSYEIIPLNEFEERLEEYLMDNDVSEALRKLRMA